MRHIYIIAGAAALPWLIGAVCALINVAPETRAPLNGSTEAIVEASTANVIFLSAFLFGALLTNRMNPELKAAMRHPPIIGHQLLLLLAIAAAILITAIIITLGHIPVIAMALT